LKILIVTGTLAEESVRRYASESEREVDVIALPVSVAAFITPKLASEALKAPWVKNYDAILLPGYVQGDVSPVEATTGVSTFKGPVHAADLPVVLDMLDQIELSKTVPASEILKDELRRRATAEIDSVNANWSDLLRDHGGMIIGGAGREVPIGRAFPMRVIAEIVNAPTLELGTILKLARYYEAEGADVIDIGMLAGKPQPERIASMVETVRGATTRPVSIDTLEPSEIEAAIDSGVDLVLSVDSGNMEDVASAVQDTPVVVLPSNMREGLLPRRAEDRVEMLARNIERANDLGMKNVIADPVLEPAIQPGLMESLMAYKLFRRIDETTPMLFGLGNVTELIDVDSPGVNGLLSALACELGANLLFVPEFSAKARESVRETSTASKMMFLSARKDTVPKDLGIDLLILKEKRWREEPYERRLEETIEVIKSRQDASVEMDRSGWFKIEVDREDRMITAIHYPYKRSDPDSLIKGANVAEVYKTIVRRGLVSSLYHAAYLGKELEKAGIALRLGRSYVQDEDLFP
jgi:dihydropteroate synthase-like protein